MESYPTSNDKIALAVSSSMAAKEIAVKQYGIGEELSFTIFGWRDDRLAIVANLAQKFMREEQDVRLNRCHRAAQVIRRGWAVDAFTFLAEAFCSTDSTRSVGQDLRQLFIDRDPNVFECLTFTHVTSDNIDLVSVPYSLQLGATVEWHEPIRNVNASGLRDSAYPKIFSAALDAKVPAHPDNMDAYQEILAGGLLSNGFACQYDFD